MLKTEISPEKAHGLRELHRLCDWVITLDRNAGIEYFDSPRDNREIYDACVIDCVPEREDLGCLQLITSASNLEEVRNLLDGALDQMGLSRSRRNAEFLMKHLKALSGRLAIRFNGQKAPTSELIALALSHASCFHAKENDDCWTSLRHGFLIPVDDVRDLLPPLTAAEGQDNHQSDAKAARPDLIYVSFAPRRGLYFQFIEVKYRRSQPAHIASPSGSSSTSGETRLPEIGQEKPAPPSVILGTDFFSGTEVSWSVNIKGNPHLLVAGLPGMGKTTCLLNICKQIYHVGILPIIFSYHQDIDEQLGRLSIPIQFITFQRLTFNPLRVFNREARLTYLDVAGALRDIFLAIYPELGDIQGERLRTAIKESFVEQGWGDPTVDHNQLPEPHFGRFLEILRATPKPDRGLQTLLARLEELADYGFFDLNDTQESLWESDRPIVLQIHATQNQNLQKAFASLIFYGLYKDMFRRGIQSRITHAVVFDEAHHAAKLKLIPTMAKECRKYGISLILALQEAKDFDTSLCSAVANYLVLRLNEVDAKALVRNVASSDQERLLIDKIK